VIRSVCIVTREFPPETAYGGIARLAHMQAHAFVEAGLAVHVLSLAPDGVARTVLDGGVVVHRIPQPAVEVAADMPYAIAGAWSHAVSTAYAALDAAVRFDVVQAQDYHAETLHLVRRPETPIVVYLNAPMRVLAECTGRPQTAGQRAFAELEGAALKGADLLLHPTELVLAETRRVFGELPPAALCPHQFDVRRFAFPERTPWAGGPLPLIFVGRLEPLKGADLALRALVELRGRGVDARLTLVGRDVPQADGSSYRRGVLVPLLDELGLDFGDVRFVDQLDEAGVARHLLHAAAAILPSRIENFHTAAVEALAAGVPVITSDRNGLSCWVGTEDGLHAVPIADPNAFAEGAADALCDEAWLADASVRGAALVQRLFDPVAVTERQLGLYAEAIARRAPARPAARPAPAGPELAVIVLAHNALPYTQRCLGSLLAHTSTTLRVYLVDNASTDGTASWAAGLDERVTVVRSDANLGVAGGRNAGLAAIEGEPDYVVFFDNDVEVTAGWWVPFVGALEGDRSAGIAGERGVRITVTETGRETESLDGPGPVEADMAIGFCMVMRAAAVAEIGRFDENMGLFWHDDDDYGMRARRLGWRVLHVGSGRVLHFEHRSSSLVEGIWDGPEEPSDLSRRNQEYLAGKWRSRGQGPLEAAGADLAVLAFADELLEAPELLGAFASHFSAADSATLVIYAPGWEPGALGDELGPVIEQAGLAGEEGPELVALAVPDDPETELSLALGIDAVLTRRAPTGVFQAPPHYDEKGGEALHLLASRFSRAESHVSFALATASVPGIEWSDEPQPGPAVAVLDPEPTGPLLPLYEEEPGLLRSCLCSQAYMETESYASWCARFEQLPMMHRKQWEYVIICEALHERGLLASGKRGIGFGVGTEPLPALFASHGCEIVATDLAVDAAASLGWVDGNQHAASLDTLNSLGLCPPGAFKERVSFRSADMNDIPTDLRGFDFTWSSCCFEHLGSIEHGLRFVERSLDCLRPGGIAIHTTEFNLSSNDDTIREGGTVIFRRRDIDRLAQRLTAQGHKICLDYTEGTTLVDRFVDVPPYEQDPHLRLLLEGYVSTSICLIVRKAG